MSHQSLVEDQPVRSGRSGVAHGFVLFAGVIMIMAGTFQAVAGVVGLVANEFYVASRTYLFQFDATSWAGSTSSSGCWLSSPVPR